MNLHLAEPDYNSALEVANAIVANDAEDSFYYAALYYKPFCMSKLDRKEEAMAAYKEANSIYRLETLNRPEAVDIYLYRAMCLKDMEQYDKALELLDFVQDIAGEMAEIYNIRGNIFNLQGRTVKANEQLEKAYQLKPELRPAEEKGDE